LTQVPRWGPIALPDIRPFGADCGSPRHRDIRKFAKRVALEFGKGGWLGHLTAVILWTLCVVTTSKYVNFAMRVHNDGEGGIVALLAL
jgi:K+ transporter